jgi:hypothetical protein
MSHDFKVVDRKFRLTGLKLREALAAEAIIVQTGLPVGAAFSTGRVDAGALRSALVSLGPQVQTLVDMFVSVCEVDWEGKGAYVALEAFIDEVFGRKTSMLFAWLLACIEWQFADFFDGTGLPLLKQAASRFTSLFGSIGGSGESQHQKK